LYIYYKYFLWRRKITPTEKK